MRMSLESNIRAVERDLSDAARRQVPFATSLALNEMAEAVRDHETARLEKVLDRPTPFTRKAYAMRRSTKRRLEARVFIKAIQARYLEAQEEGGTRTPKRRALVVPAAIRKNKYGNIARGAVKRNLAKPAVFSGTPRGGGKGPGVYQRKGKRLVKLVSYAKRARYSPRLGFKRSASRFTSQRFPVIWEKALRCAFASRRR